MLACLACLPGLYTLANGSRSERACVNCPAGTYWLANGGCQDCPASTSSPPGALGPQECMALLGYYGVPGQPASLCPVDSFCIQGAMQPAPCPQDTTAPEGSHACLLQPVMRAVLWDWVVLPIWFFVAVLGVGCVVRSRRFWRPRVGQAFTRGIPLRIRI